MPRWLVGQLDNTFRPGGAGRENNKEISNDAKTKVPLCESLGSNLGLNTQSITKNWSYVWNCPHLRLVEWHKTSYLGHNSPSIANGTMDLKVKNVRQQQNKLSPDEARQWAEPGVIEMTKKAESKTWRLLRKIMSWKIWLSISSYLIHVIQCKSSFICVLKVINFELYVQGGEVERFKS